MARRERWAIYGAILAAIDEQVRRAGADARVSNVATTANLPYDRLQQYLEELAQAGLVTRDRMPGITPSGRELLAKYRQWVEVLDRFGLR